VSAALETKFEGVRHGSRIAKLVKGIVPALDEIDAKSPPARRLRAAVEANVRWTVQQIRRTPEGRARAAEGIMKVVGAVCQIKTGRTRLI
jgi:carbonic anhydrase